MFRTPGLVNQEIENVFGNILKHLKLITIDGAIK